MHGLAIPPAVLAGFDGDLAKPLAARLEYRAMQAEKTVCRADGIKFVNRSFEVASSSHGAVVILSFIVLVLTMAYVFIALPLVACGRVLKKFLSQTAPGVPLPSDRPTH